MDDAQLTLGYGLCECGCGERTPLAAQTDPRFGGRIKGQPLRWIQGHSHRRTGPDYVEEDRGFTTPCWIWQHALTHGYGVVSVQRRLCRAHRLMYERAYGAIPAGLELDHLCRVRACVNPDHLEPVTTMENVRRGAHTKLTIEIAREMRARVAAGETQKALGLEYGTSSGHVSDIVHHKRWPER